MCYGQGMGQLLTQGMCVGVLWSGYGSSTDTRHVCYCQGRGQLLTQGMCVGVLWSG